MPELASDPDLGGTGKEGDVSRHCGHRIGGVAVCRSECFVHWGSSDIPGIPPPHRSMKGVMLSAEGSDIKVPQERSCSWGAPSFRVLLVLGPVGFLSMTNGSHGSP